MGTLPPSTNAARGFCRSTVSLMLVSELPIVSLIVPEIAASFLDATTECGGRREESQYRDEDAQGLCIGLARTEPCMAFRRALHA